MLSQAASFLPALLAWKPFLIEKISTRLVTSEHSINMKEDKSGAF